MIPEYDLKFLPENDLIDIMVESINELFVLKKMKDKERIGEKRKEVQLIQKIIAYKRMEQIAPPLSLN